MIRKRFFSLVVMLVLLLPAAGAPAEEPLSFVLAKPLLEGADNILLRFSDTPPGLRVNAFSGGEQLGGSAQISDDGLVVILLKRSLALGEEVLVAADTQTDGTSIREARAVFTVLGRFGSHLKRLRARVDSFWPLWRDIWLPAYLDGTLYFRLRFEDLPFVTFPDEVPEIDVTEKDGAARVYLAEPLPEGWQISFAAGMPVTLTDAVPDGDAWTGAAGFDSVYLVSPQAADRMSITIVYQRSDAFLPSWPIVEWVEPEAEEPCAFNCYGFGTTRSFGGGMYAIVGGGEAWYAEYGNDGSLADYFDLVSECMYDKEQNLISGDEALITSRSVDIW